MERVMDFHRGSFARAGAFAFLGEAVAHVLVIIGNLPVPALSRWGLPNLLALSKWGFLTDWFFIILGGYSAVGLWLYWSQVRIKRCRDCFWYWFITLFITITVLLHAYIILSAKHEILENFPWWYSFLGLAYCLFFAWREPAMRHRRRWSRAVPPARIPRILALLGAADRRAFA
jgi:hypothetical protein